MSASIFEKVVALGFIGTSVAFVAAMALRGNKADKKDAFRVRQEILKRNDTKMLYSTMSFFYLQGFTAENLDSFYALHSILEIEKPNLVVVPISREEYEGKYRKMMQHPKYREAMDRLKFNLKNRNDQ